MPSVLTRYRVMAYITGVVLATCCLFGFSFWPWAAPHSVAAIMWTAHGYLYMVYLIAAFMLAIQARWSLLKTLLVMAAGTIPLMSFVAERRVTHSAQSALERSSA